MAKWIVKNKKTDESLLDRVLSIRGIVSQKQKDDFLNPDFDNNLHDPFLLSGMESAVDRILTAIKNKEIICIFGDYDADGVTASALLYRTFKFIGIEPEVVIPHRINDGYGITLNSIDLAIDKKASLIITVDNGITGNDAVDKANQNGIDVIITDHHLPTNGIPDAYAVLNPNVEGDTYPFKKLSGVGVAYKLAAALLGKIQGISPESVSSHLKWILDFVAIGTVADVMELTGENRVLVYYGLKVIAKSKMPGINALLNVSSENRANLNSQTIGFSLGPRINAAGRLEGAETAFKLLITEDRDEAVDMAAELNRLNTKRRGMVDSAMRSIDKHVESQLRHSERILLLKSSDWHPGVIGLIAGKVSEKYNLPSIVMTNFSDADNYVASCRSIPSFDISKMIEALKSHFTRRGGHSQAGGFSMSASGAALFEENLYSYAKQVSGEADIEKEIYIDSLIREDEIDMKNLNEIQKLFPFGQGNPEPVFLLKDAALSEMRPVGKTKKHLRIGARINKGIVYGIGFSLAALCDEINFDANVDIIFNLRENTFNGFTSVQMMVLDMKNIT